MCSFMFEYRVQKDLYNPVSIFSEQITSIIKPELPDVQIIITDNRYNNLLAECVIIRLSVYLDPTMIWLLEIAVQ